jgi:protein SCO1/2
MTPKRIAAGASVAFSVYLLLVTAAAAVAHARPATRVTIERYANGQVRRRAEYRDGKLDGTVRQWYENGSVMLVHRYRAGLSDGTQRQWYPNGQLWTSFHHHEGHELGQQQMWNPDGTIRSNYVIRDGRRYGLVGATGCTGEKVSRLPYYRTAALTPEWLPAGVADGRDMHRVGAFRAVDQAGAVVTERALAGKVTVAHFFFTQCGDVCPSTSRNLARLLRELPNAGRLQVLSYSVAPERDSLDALRAFAALRHIDDTRWHLLSGTREGIDALAHRSYFVRLGADTTYGVSRIAHTESLVLVDGHGRLRGVYAGTLPLEIDRLREDIAVLIGELEL